LNTNDRKKNFEALKAVVETFPLKDRDPIYIPNEPQEWDVEISAQSQVWKK